MIGIVSAIISVSLIWVIFDTLPETETQKDPSITWYFLPNNCFLGDPEDTQLCLVREGCGSGLLYKSSKWQGPVDTSELWKWQDGLVKIDYSECKVKFPEGSMP